MCAYKKRNIVVFPALMIFANVTFGKENIFLCDYANKWGKIPIVAIYTNSEKASEFTYVVKNIGGDIGGVKKYHRPHEYKFERKTDGNIYVIGLERTCFSSANFARGKLNSDHFYQKLSPEFMKLNNEARVGILEQLASKTN